MQKELLISYMIQSMIVNNGGIDMKNYRKNKILCRIECSLMFYLVKTLLTPGNFKFFWFYCCCYFLNFKIQYFAF